MTTAERRPHRAVGVAATARPWYHVPVRLALVLALAAALACSGGVKSVHVTSIVLADGAAPGPLREAGLDDAAIEGAVREALLGAGFRFGEGSRAHRARVDVPSVRLAPPVAAGTSARVEMSVQIELAPAELGKGVPVRETGTAAAALKGGDPRAAWLSAVAEASRHAADGLAIAFAEESKPVEALVSDLGSRDWRVRDHAIRVLADRKSTAAVPALLDRLKDEDARIVHRAVGALAQIGDERAVAPLIDLSRSGDGALAARIARIIGDIGGAEAEGYLLTISSGHPDPRVRRAAREALADMGTRVQKARVAARK